MAGINFQNEKFIYLASPNKKTAHTHKIIRQGDHYSLANYSGSHVK